jgi:O-antigen ligase/polysaccharide polymerase Wzy-like membrane protein
MKTEEATFNSGFLTFASLSVLAFAALLAVVLQSSAVFLVLLCAAIVPLIGTFYPPVVLVFFLFANLLVPKLPLIPIKGYMVPIRIEDVLLACALACLLLRYLIFKEKPAPNLLQRWMVVFCSVTGLSLLFGLFILGSVPGAKIGFLYWLRSPEYFAASYLCALGVTNWRQYRQMIVALAIFVTLIGVYGILQEFSLVPIFNAMHQDNEIVTIQMFPSFGEERLFSTFAGPYDLAAFYLIAIPIFVGLFTTVTSRVAKVALAAVLGLSFFCFYLTFARAPLVALVVALAVCLWLLGRRRLGVGLALASVLPAFVFGGFVERLSSAAEDPFGFSALGGRLGGSWASALSAAARSPLLGTGPASLSLTGPGSLTLEGLGVDGLYFMLLGMWGIVGLVCFLFLIGKAIHFQRECIRTTRNQMQRALAIGLFAGSVGLLVDGIVGETFFFSKIAFSYWFLMGLLFAGRALEKQVSAETAELFVETNDKISPRVPSGRLLAPAPGDA